MFQRCEPVHKTQHCYPLIAWPQLIPLKIVISSLKSVYAESLVDLNDDLANDGEC
jgi:hypothetical protein